ncbi:hypothetical protein [Methanobrevibacter sp.]|uniref:hypothetical protein n=1 Tax=Methanobrevibacter sp. TaxID=66852 RepID=UPI0038906276
MAAPIKPANEDKSSIRKELAIRNVVNDLMDGGVYSVIKEKLMEDEYGIGKKYTEGTAKAIIKFARKRIKDDFEEQLPDIRASLTNMLYDLFTEAKDMGDRMNAIKCIQEIAKLTGAYEPTKVEAKVENIVIDFNLTDEGTD